MKKHEKIILVGGGGHCHSVIDVIECENKYLIAGIVDTTDRIGENVLGYQIKWDDSSLDELVNEYINFHITIGFIKNPERRISLYQKLCNNGAIFPVITSPFAVVSRYAKIGGGTIIMHHAQVNPMTRVGENCIINSKALIEHDVIVGNHCHISTGAIVNGYAIIGNACFLGSGSVIVNGSLIPDHSFIRANKLYATK